MSDKLTSPFLTWNAQGLPVSDQFDDPYFSVENGLEETRYVFLQQNQLPKRWRNWQSNFRIIETGFGTGLNFLATWQAFSETANNECWLHFTSIEKYPLTLEQLRQALALWPELSHLSERLIEAYPNLTPGFHSLIWPDARVQLTLIFDDVHNALPQLSGPVHAWYLDGFAPSKNPEMWADSLFQQMRRLSLGQQDCSFATFTAAGLVRRGIKGAGFHVNKVAGFGRKREMLSGQYRASNGPEQPSTQHCLPWLCMPEPIGKTPSDAQVAIIGAGLAGCTTARALAERGFKVSIYDKTGIAAGASGNPQGGLYIKLAADEQATHSDFYRQAYEVALNRVQDVLGAPASEQDSDLAPTWDNCGVVQIAWSQKEQDRQTKFLEKTQPPQTLLEQTPLGLRFTQAGWVSPKDFCEALLEHPHICFKQAEITNLTELTADAIVLANASQAKDLLPEAYIPSKTIRGQISYLKAEGLTELEQVYCAQGYMAPARDGKICLGATYNLHDESEAIRESDHLTNLAHLKDFPAPWPELAEAALTSEKPDLSNIVGGRVGFRCTTPDYLPMVGPIADTQQFLARFVSLTKNAKRIPQQAMPWQSNLYLNIGHGSRGLSSTALCADLIVSMLTGDAPSVSNQVLEALLPSRFLLRDMIRGKIKPS